MHNANETSGDEISGQVPHQRSLNTDTRHRGSSSRKHGDLRGGASRNGGQPLLTSARKGLP